jgi:alkylhydroperoxidase family enzyme
VPVPALEALAPEAFAAWQRVRASLPAAVDAGDLAVVESGVATALGLEAAPATTAGDAALRSLVDQFVCDVASVSDAQRAAAFGVLGDRAFPFGQACYVLDMDVRMRAAWRQLLDAESPAASDETSGDLWADLETFMRAVARLDALDAVMTEIVRLRGARAHNCRLCQSTRSVPAARAGADERVYDQIDAYDSDASELTERQQVALRLVDAFLWQPLAYPAGLAGTVMRVFSPAETVEIVLDVVRNAANKIAVLFAADAPHVTDGFEPFDITPEGEVVYLPPEVHDARS